MRPINSRVVVAKKVILQAPRFGVNDKAFVRTTGEGPFWVARVNHTSSPPQYILCLENGQAVKNGREIAEGDIRRG